MPLLIQQIPVSLPRLATVWSDLIFSSKQLPLDRLLVLAIDAWLKSGLEGLKLFGNKPSKLVSHFSPVTINLSR